MKRKVYVNPGDMIEVHVVHPAFEPNASGAREQSYKSSILLGVVSSHEIAFSDPMTRLVPWSDVTRAEKERNDD